MMPRQLELYTCVAVQVTVNDDGTYTMGTPYETENPWAFSDDQAVWDVAASEEAPMFEGWFSYGHAPQGSWDDFSDALRVAFVKE